MKKYLVVGLGNIGEQYANTRHNIGFSIVDQLASEEELSFKDGRLGEIAKFKYKGRSVLCLKPSTYMNLSGKAVKYWMDHEKIPLENLLVITWRPSQENKEIIKRPWNESIISVKLYCNNLTVTSF